MGDPMEELSKRVTSAFNVSGPLESSTTQHPRFTDYKAARVTDQITRRQRQLELLKQNRFDYVAHLRRLADDDWSGDETGSATLAESDCTPMEEDALPRPGRKYQNQLMLSEWLVDVPTDLESEWLVVPAPTGKRSLIVASKGRTSAYTKSGYCVDRFSSRLPGGHFTSTSFSGYTILDCIFNELDKVYYILDVLCWNGHPVTDCEAEFRQFWVRSKVQECPGCTQHSKKNLHKFAVLPYSDCKRTSLEQFMQQDLGFGLDGLLFYHRRVHYLFGTTPLVGWLKPYMLPEVLGVPVPAIYLDRIPPGYASFADHMIMVQKDRASGHEQKQAAEPRSRRSRPRAPHQQCHVPQQMDSLEVTGAGTPAVVPAPCAPGTAELCSDAVSADKNLVEDG